MVEIEEQLRRYGNALAAVHGPSEGVAGSGEGGGDHPAPADRHRLAFLGVAAAVMVAVIGAVVVVADHGDQTVTTDDPVSSADEFEVPLPSDERWRVLWVDRSDQGQTGSPIDVVAFEFDGSLIVLTVGEGDGERSVPFDEAEPEVLYNRVTLRGQRGRWDIGLTGFDMDATTLRSLADTLRHSDGAWLIPEVDVIVAEHGVRRMASGESTTVEMAPLANDGTIDRSRVVTISSAPGSEGSLYAMVAEASSLGVTRGEVPMFGGTGFLAGGSGASGKGVLWAASYQDGRLLVVRSTSATVDLEALLAVTEPANEADLRRRALDDATGN